MIGGTRALADEIARVAEAQPFDGIDNVGEPDKITFEQMARDVLAKQGDTRPSSSIRTPPTLGRPSRRIAWLFLRKLISAYERR